MTGTGAGDALRCDVIVAGGGPAGLAIARALAGSRLDVTLVERQPLARLADPADVGREIALTHRSAATLRAARVLDGRSPFAFSFSPPDAGGGGGMLL